MAHSDSQTAKGMYRTTLEGIRCETSLPTAPPRSALTQSVAPDTGSLRIQAAEGGKETIGRDCRREPGVESPPRPPPAHPAPPPFAGHRQRRHDQPGRQGRHRGAATRRTAPRQRAAGLLAGMAGGNGGRESGGWRQMGRHCGTGRPKAGCRGEGEGAAGPGRPLGAVRRTAVCGIVATRRKPVANGKRARARTRQARRGGAV